MTLHYKDGTAAVAGDVINWGSSGHYFLVVIDEGTKKWGIVRLTQDAYMYNNLTWDDLPNQFTLYAKFFMKFPDFRKFK